MIDERSKMKKRGFTLIELLLVVSIIALSASLSAPFYARFINQNSVENATVQFLADIHKAKMNAMMGKQNSNWGVHYASNTITLYKGSSFGVDNSFNETFSVPSGTTVSGFTDVNFTRATGIPNTTATITISAPGNNTSTVTINAQGVGSR